MLQSTNSHPLIATNYCRLFLHDWKSLLCSYLCMLCLLIHYFRLFRWHRSPPHPSSS